MMNVSVRMEDQKLLEQRITDMKNKVNCSEHELISDEDPFYSAENQKLLEQRITDMKNKVNCSEHGLISDEDPFYSAENQKRLERSIRHAKEGKLTEHELIEA